MVSFPNHTPTSHQTGMPASQARFGNQPVQRTLPIGHDTVQFGSNEGGDTPEADKPSVLQRLKAGSIQGLKSGINPSSLLIDTLWSSLFVGISALLTAGPGGILAAPFIPIVVATGACIRGIFGFARGFSNPDNQNAKKADKD